MNTKQLPYELVKDVMFRSKCNVMVGAVLVDKHGIFSWGWNHTRIWAPSDCAGEGVHAEYHAILRANPRRLKGAEIYVMGMRKRNNKFVESHPCPECMAALRKAKIKRYHYHFHDHWVTQSL